MIGEGEIKSWRVTSDGRDTDSCWFKLFRDHRSRLYLARDPG